MGDRSGLSRRDYLRGIGAAGVVATGGLAGCSVLPGGSDTDTYTVAATVPKSGEYSSVGQAMERGYNYGADGENTRRNVASFFDDNTEFEIIVRDDESDPDRVTEQLDDIASGEETEVNMVWGSYGMDQSHAAAEWAEEREILCFLPFAPHEAPYNENSYQWTFAAGPTTSNIAVGTAGIFDDMSSSDRPSTFAIWEPDSAFGTEMADRWEHHLGEANGEYEVVLRETFETGTEDFGDLISTTMDADPDVLLSNPSQTSAIAAMRGIEEAGWSPGAIQFSWGADRPGWWEELGSTGEYVLSTPGWVQGSTRQGSATFLSRYGETHGYSAEDGDLIPPAAGGAFTVAQFTTIHFSEEDDLFDADNIRDSVRNDRAEAAVGNIVFDEGTNGVPRGTALPAVMGQWYDGDEFETGQRAAFGAPGDVSYSGINLQYPMPAWDER